MEAEKCLAQSEKINDEKVEFESAIYEKVCSISYFVFSASYMASVLFSPYFSSRFILRIELQM